MLQSMKKIFSKVMLVAAAAMAFFACQKPEVIEPETSHEVMLTFSSEKPEFNDETKTEWTGETIQWSKGDKIRVAYTCNGVWQNADGNATSDETEGNKSAKLYASTELESAMEIATFKVPTTFKVNEDNENAVHEFYALYPSNLTTSTSLNFAPSVTVSLLANQTPSATSFDASADMMIAKSNFYTGIPTEAISLKWNRLVAHGYLTLKALAVDGPEKVESIVLTANAEADMVGKHYVDFETQVVTKSGETATNVITIDGANLSIDADGNVSFWVSFLPCTWTSLKVEVETNKASYTREIDLSANQKTFVKNARNVLGIGMASATRVAKEAPVADYSGTYVIVAERNSEKKFYYMTAVDAGASTKRFVAVLAGETCPTDVEGLDDTYRWDISKSGDSYVVTSVQNGQSISWTSGNSAFLAPTGLPFEVTENENGTFTFKYAHSDGDRFISLNGNTGNDYFALYKSGQAMNLYLLPVTPNTAPKVTLEQTSLELTADASEGTITISTKYVSDVRVTAKVEKDAQEESEWLTADYVDGKITYSAPANDSEARTAYIEVYVNGEDGSSFSTGIEVTQAAYVAEPAAPQVVTVKEFLAQTVSSNIWYQLTGVIEGIYNTTYGNFYLNDGTDKVLVYGLTATQQTTNDKTFASLGLRDGDIVTLIGTRADHQGTAQVGGPAYYVSHQSVSDAPVISYQDNVVTIAAATGATVYYTIDGTNPTTASTMYTTAFEITEDTTVKAIALEDGKLVSTIAVAECIWKDPNAGGDDTIVATSGTVLWSETWADAGSTSTTFASNAAISTYNYAGRTGFEDNATSVTYTADASNNVRITKSSGGNCSSGHLWFNKSVAGELKTSAIKLYGATSLTFSHSQGTSGSSCQTLYSVNGGSTWTSLGTQSGAIATKTYSFTVPAGTESVMIKLVHAFSNSKNTRVDNLVLKVK